MNARLRRSCSGSTSGSSIHSGSRCRVFSDSSMRKSASYPTCRRSDESRIVGGRMDLKSGCMLWPELDSAAAPNFPRLDRDQRCDVAIIGGGITGALCAYHLTEDGA